MKAKAVSVLRLTGRDPRMGVTRPKTGSTGSVTGALAIAGQVASQGCAGAAGMSILQVPSLIGLAFGQYDSSADTYIPPPPNPVVCRNPERTGVLQRAFLPSYTFCLGHS